MAISSNSISNQVLLHDGTTTGILCALAEGFRLQHTNPALVVEFIGPNTMMPLFENEQHHISSDVPRAGKFLDYIAAKSSASVTRGLLRVLMTQPRQSEPILLRYIQKCVRTAGRIDRSHADDDVKYIHQQQRKVSHEIHRFKGLMRFEQNRDGWLIAIYHPDYEINLPLALHFTKRLAGERWVIWNARYHCGMIWDGNQLNPGFPDDQQASIDDVAPFLNRAKDETETRIQELWRRFHRTVAIENRSNSKLQRQCMPARYWQHLTEMQPRSGN